MNRNLLIDQVVRQTMVLIAHLATHGGTRTPLSDVADRVFRSLVDELEAQSLSHKVIADMFGLALRTYYDRVKRLTESATMRGRSLWEALYQYVQYQEKATRDAILSRFRHDDDQMVRAVLHDLTQSGLLAKHGRGVRTAYSVVQSPDVDQRKTLTALVQVALFHHGETGAAALAASLGAAEDAVADALEALALDGRAEALRGDPVRYRVTTYLIPASDPAGFEAAVLDHVQAFIGALCHRLRRRGAQTPIDGAIGGSTYTFDLAPDNPAWDRVVGLLTRARAELSALRSEADAFEAARTAPARTLRFHFYCGENVLGEALPASAGEPRRATPSGEPS